MATLPELLQDARREQRLGPAHHDRHAAADPRARAPEAARPAVARAGRDQDAGLQRAHRRAEEALRGGAGAGLLVRHPRHRALPLQRVQPARRRRRRLPRHPRADQGLQRARPAAGARQPRRAAARPGPRHRPDRLGQVDDAGGDDRQDQHRAARAHPHDRGPDRVRPPAQGLPGQPARGAPGHAGLRQRAARGAPRGPRRRPDRRAARPRDDRVGAAHRRDRALDVRDAAHQLGGADDQPHHRRVPGAPAGADPHAALAGASRASSVRRCCRARTARAASSRWRSWCRTRRSGT